MDEAFDIPGGVVAYIRDVFSYVNDRVSHRISTNPNISEENLDISFIESLQGFAGPTCVESAWAVRIATHFIGNIGHYRRYEIADVGVVVVFKISSRVVARKLVLLQSKRLYPLNNQVEIFDEFDRRLGLALVTRGDKQEASIFSSVVYQFTNHSIYGAMIPDSKQCQAIAQHFGETDIPVHYMMYNPVVIPWQITYPLSIKLEDIPARELGTRILESDHVHRAMASTGRNSSPSLADLSNGVPTQFGLPLETFFEDVVRCRKGYKFLEDRDEGIRRLFSRKSGPIFCVVEITIEMATQ